MLLDFNLKAFVFSTGRRGLFGSLAILFYVYAFLIALHRRRPL